MLLNEAREPGSSSTRNQKTRTVSTCRINLGGLLLSGPVLRDTARLSQRYPGPLLRAIMGFLVSQHGKLGAIPPPPFPSISPLESMQSGGAIPPPLKRGISAILAQYPMKTRQMVAIPPSAILSRKGIARYGGVSRTGPLSIPFRDGETTIKIEFCVFEGGRIGGREENCPKTLLFSLGNATTMKILKVQILLSRTFVVIARAPNHRQQIVTVHNLSSSGRTRLEVQLQHLPLP